MANRLLKAGYCLRAGLGLAVLAAQLCRPEPVPARTGIFLSLRHHKAATEDATQAKPSATASQQPVFSIPVEPLGFYAPGPFYQGQRESLVSLDFLDENRLLFTFRAPGLIHRTSGINEDERQIRAEVLTLPNGALEAEALWTLHDHDRYLWMLKDGHFLLRDQDTLKEGNASLELKSLLQFPGPLLRLEMDPAQQFLVTNSREPDTAQVRSGQVTSPTTASASISEEEPQGDGRSNIVVRILHRLSGQVMLVSRVRSTVHLPINSDGYLESLRGSGRDWLLNLNFFAGGSKILGRVDSACRPPIDFISQTEALVNTCAPQGGRSLVALSTEGRRLWNAPSAPTQVWPLLIVAQDGTRLARETLTVSHPVEVFSPLSFDDVSGQLVEIYDAATGKLVLKAPASPVLDGGGNVAISPSGRRVAVLDAGAIRIYELSAAAGAVADNLNPGP